MPVYQKFKQLLRLNGRACLQEWPISWRDLAMDGDMSEASLPGI
jgi:hypothetical protein